MTKAPTRELSSYIHRHLENREEYVRAVKNYYSGEKSIQVPNILKQTGGKPRFWYWADTAMEPVVANALGIAGTQVALQIGNGNRS